MSYVLTTFGFTSFFSISLNDFFFYGEPVDYPKPETQEYIDKW